MSQKVGVDGFLGRWIFALLLVLGTYNPSGFSYFSWVFGEDATFGPVITIVGIVLLIEYKWNKRYFDVRIKVPNIPSHPTFNRNCGKTGQLFVLISEF